MTSARRQKRKPQALLAPQRYRFQHIMDQLPLWEIHKYSKRFLYPVLKQRNLHQNPEGKLLALLIGMVPPTPSFSMEREIHI